jgi:hypothetical protein
LPYNLLAPIIVGGFVAIIGLAVLIWMNTSEPRLRLPIGSEEEPSLPSEQRTPSKLSPEERLLRHIFGESDGNELLVGPSLSALAEENGRIEVTSRRATQPADK